MIVLFQWHAPLAHLIHQNMNRLIRNSASHAILTKGKLGRDLLVVEASASVLGAFVIHVLHRGGAVRPYNIIQLK